MNVSEATQAQPGAPSGERRRLDAGARLIGAVATAAFAPTLREVLHAVCEFDSMVVTEFAAGRSPTSLWHDLDELQATIHISFYEAGPYQLDPFYLTCMRDGQSGVFRLLDLVTDSFLKSEYYRIFFRKIGLSDEIGILVRENSGRCISISLARRSRRARFSETDLQEVRALFPLVEAAALRHWGERTGEGERAKAQPSMQDFGSDILSAREQEIVRLILQGHSTPSAAALLGIAEGTVKVHRRHAYAKLGISSQAQLFSRASSFLAARAGLDQN